MLKVVLACVLALVGLAQGQTVKDHEQVVVCYLATWSVYRPARGQFTLDDVNPMLCTHLVYSFLGIDERAFTLVSLDPEYDVNNGGFEKAITLRQANPKLKVTIAVGGWTEGSEKYSVMASTPASRRAFINSVIEFLNKYDFDGLDLDWEYPANRGGRIHDRENFVLLVKELREVFNNNGWMLTAAVGAGKSIIDSAYDIPRLSRYLDYIHLMSYDYHGRWDLKTGHNSPLYPRADESPLERMLNVNFSVRYYISLGTPPSKFVLGVGLYGRTFLLNDTSNPGIGAPSRRSAFAGPYTREDGFLGYNEICEKLISERSWSVAWQEAHQAPYMFRDNMWVSFDDVNSLGIKVAYAQRLGLAGIMAWSIDTDDFGGHCGARYPLLTAINRNLALHSKDRFRERITPGIPIVPLTPGILRPGLTFPEDGLQDILGVDPTRPRQSSIDFDLSSHNNINDARYYPIGRRRSSATSLALSATVVLSLAISAILAA